MSRSLWIPVLLVALGSTCTKARSSRFPERPAELAQQEWMRRVDSLAVTVDRLERAAEGPNVEVARQAFRAARAEYKSIEFAAAYYEPTTARLANGPALPRVEHDEGPEAVFPPEGFQVVEELLFAGDDVADRARLVEEVRNLRELVTRLRNAMSAQQVTDAHVWDAAKLGIARVATLGLAGFDSPVANDALRESVSALQGIRTSLAHYDSLLGTVDEQEWPALDNAFRYGIARLDSVTDADAFDRLTFIAQDIRRISHSVIRARRTLGIKAIRERRAFALEAASLFDADAFDANAFAAPGREQATDSIVALGRVLFNDTKLSGSGAKSCASCHAPDNAFSDGRAKSTGLITDTKRNAPTLLNAGLQLGQFYDLRTTYLEDQVNEVVRNPNEMHGNIDPATSMAIAAYIRSLTSLNSRVDRALRGDSLAVDAEERLGFNLFMGKAKCGTCHFAPLFNGTVPPMYDEAEMEVLGVPRVARTSGARIDPDSGRFLVTRAAPHLHAFKTPTVRNVALTAPYMHNGAYPTLESVVDFYDRGGGAGIGIALPNQTLPPDPLKLTSREKSALVRFMLALTDTTRR